MQFLDPTNILEAIKPMWEFFFGTWKDTIVTGILGIPFSLAVFAIFCSVRFIILYERGIRNAMHCTGKCEILNVNMDTERKRSVLVQVGDKVKELDQKLTDEELDSLRKGNIVDCKFSINAHDGDYFDITLNNPLTTCEKVPTTAR